MKANKIIHSVIITLTAILIIVSLLISPYKYEWEVELKQINDNSVLVLRLIYIILMAINIGGIFLILKSKTKFRCAYFFLLMFICYKLIKTFFIK